MHRKKHEDKILDIETDDSYWEFGRYCVHVDLIIWRQSHQQFVGQSQTLSLNCSTGFTAELRHWRPSSNKSRMLLILSSTQQMP